MKKREEVSRQSSWIIDFVNLVSTAVALNCAESRNLFVVLMNLDRITCSKK